MMIFSPASFVTTNPPFVTSRLNRHRKISLFVVCIEAYFRWDEMKERNKCSGDEPGA